jgi:uncharacterized RDD family membrane protein YckC
MENVHVFTAHNIAIEYPIASIGDRMVANIVDALIQFAYFFSISIFYITIFSPGGDPLFMMIFLLPLMFYHLVLELGMEGQTIGMRMMKTKVVRVDGSSPTLGNYLIRWLFRIVDIYFFYGPVAIVTFLLNGKGQRLGDMAAGTTVVKLKERTKSHFNLDLEDQAGYKVTFPDVIRLSDKDINLVKLAMQAYVDQGKEEPMIAAAEKLNHLLGLNSAMKPWEMLKTIVSDYTHLTGKVA